MTPKAAANRNASGNEGAYLPASNATIVCRAHSVCQLLLRHLAMLEAQLADSVLQLRLSEGVIVRAPLVLHQNRSRLRHREDDKA